MYKPENASVLVPAPKRYFNPENEQDLMEFHYYVLEGTWRDTCPFMIEWPRVSIPDMIGEKILRRHMGTILDAIRAEKLINKEKYNV